MEELLYKSNAGFVFHHTLTKVEDIKTGAPTAKHAHPQYEIFYLIKGDVDYHIAGQVYHINEGDILILKSFEYHTLDVRANRDYDRFVVEFKENNIPMINGISPLTSLFHGNSLVSFISKEKVDQSSAREILLSMEKAVQNRDEFINQELLGKIITFVVEIARLARDTEENDSPYVAKESRNSEVINSVITYINSNINKKISINEIASNVGISRSFLQHMFKDTVGSCISDYINMKKMETAAYMIRNGQTLDKVAYSLGFKYYSTFSASYKKFYGHSPKEQQKEQ